MRKPAIWALACEAYAMQESLQEAYEEPEVLKICLVCSCKTRWFHLEVIISRSKIARKACVLSNAQVWNFEDGSLWRIGFSFAHVGLDDAVDDPSCTQKR